MGGTLSQKLAVQTPTFGYRGAAAVSAPVPLSTRMDGLMAKVTIALIVYFVPQDLVFWGGLSGSGTDAARQQFRPPCTRTRLPPLTSSSRRRVSTLSTWRRADLLGESLCEKAACWLTVVMILCAIFDPTELISHLFAFAD